MLLKRTVEIAHLPTQNTQADALVGKRAIFLKTFYIFF